MTLYKTPSPTVISIEERELFQIAVQKVTPLPKQNKVVFPQQAPQLLPSSPPATISTAEYEISYLADTDEVDKTLDLCLLSSASIPTVSADTSLFFMRPGLQNRLMQQLKRGVFRPEAAVDLHGFTVAQARQVLQRFLSVASEKKLRYVHIIHGKGARTPSPPVLKNNVNMWLRNYSHVLAFCSCQSIDGGTGAVYVLLKKEKI